MKETPKIILNLKTKFEKYKYLFVLEFFLKANVFFFVFSTGNLESAGAVWQGF
jgi:hypothetical protein